VGIGEKEVETLKPAKVKVEDIKITPVTFGSKINEKVVLVVKHPDRDEAIQISSVKVLKKDKVVVSGLWFYLDEDEKIRKNSVLALFLNFAGVSNLEELKGKEFETVTDEEGYLVVKAF